MAVDLNSSVCIGSLRWKIGRTLKALRLSKEMTQEELAVNLRNQEDSGCRHNDQLQRIKKIEQFRLEPSLNDIVSWVNATDSDMHSFWHSVETNDWKIAIATSQNASFKYMIEGLSEIYESFPEHADILQKSFITEILLQMKRKIETMEHNNLERAFHHYERQIPRSITKIMKKQEDTMIRKISFKTTNVSQNTTLYGEK